MFSDLSVMLGGDTWPVNDVAGALETHVSTIYRWGGPRGVRGHRLQLVRIGGRTFIRREDWERFFGRSMKLLLHRRVSPQPKKMPTKRSMTSSTMPGFDEKP